MPAVSSTQAHRVHLRTVRIQRSPRLPVTRAAMQKAKGTVNPTYPMYSVSGWIHCP